MEYTKENPLRCFFAFEGYNSQGLALNRLKQHYPDFDWVCVGRSEIDKYAIQAADALFPEAKDKNYGDISKIDWNEVPDFDLFTMSSPCQDFSQAGLQKGGAEGSGTRSSLLWECRRAILAKKPKYIVFENVKALVSQKFLPYFIKWQNELASYGYSNFAKVLNASSYGIPQNRERIFMVSILDDNASYHFPEPFTLDKRLKDVLEEEVDEKYYLSKKVIDTFIERNKINKDKGNGFKFEPTDGDCAASSVLTMPGSRPCDNYIKEPIACAMRGREVQCLTPKRTEYGKKVRNEHESGELKESRHNMQQLEPRNDGVCNTITSVQKDNLIVEPFNPYEDGTCRTLKAQYYKNGMANFKRTDGLGATGVKVIANMYENNVHGGRIYDDKGISPTICANSGGNLQPKIIQQARGFNKGGEHEISPTISSNSWECNNMLIESKILSYTRDANGKVVDRHLKDVANTIHGATDGGGNTDSFVLEQGYRIRKLTEREVFRLMDVDDEDIDKIQDAGISRSQQYKMAGNSICIGVLYHIFRKLFIDTENENKQLTLF